MSVLAYAALIINKNMIDNYGRQISYLRLSVTELCNLRCRYCMPADGICKRLHEEMMTEEEMCCAVRAAAKLGITKVRITGGEPLVKRNILSICRSAAAVPGIRQVCLTTNGILLDQMAEGLRSAGVSRLNISLDTLNSEKYSSITRGGSLEQALRGLRAALECGFPKIKINAVLVGGFNEDEIRPLAELTVKYPLDVRFIELMPMVGSSEFSADAYVPAERVLQVLPDLKAIEAGEEDQGPARLFQLPGAQGRIGLIRPLSAHFCGSCNRIRITADGMIKPCLHKEAEYSLKGLDETGMIEQLQKAILNKPKWHGELSASEQSHAGRSMNRIGG